MKYHTKYENIWTDESTMQCNNEILDYDQFNVQCPQPKSPPINSLINGRLSVKSDVASAPNI